MDAIRSFYFQMEERVRTIAGQEDPGTMQTSSTDRVIHVPLSEADWKAFLASQPQPVNWLREKIQEAIQSAKRQQSAEQTFNWYR
jgi:hypothetical protein